MNKYAIKSIDTDLLDCSTYGERDYLSGDSEIIIRKWDTNPATKYFEEARASIKLTALPHDLQMLYSAFAKGVIKFIQTASSKELS